MNVEQKVAFKLLKRFGENKLYLDEDLGIVKVSWHGMVDQQEAAAILSKGADLLEVGLANKLLLDRKHLIEFTTEARIWIKNEIIKRRGNKLIKRLNRLATVNADSSRGSVFSNFLTSAIKIVYPNLKTGRFKTVEEAINWLIAE